MKKTPMRNLPFTLLIALTMLWLAGSLARAAAEQQVPGPGQPAPEIIVLQGKIVGPQRACTHELAYDFLSNDGLLAEVWIGDYTTIPYIDYWPNYLDEIRITAHKRLEPVSNPGLGPDPPPRDLPCLVALKVEVIKDTYYETYGEQRQAGLELAREMVYNRMNYGDEGHDFILKHLNQLNDQDVQKIRDIIFNDVENETNMVLGCPLWRDYRAMVWIYNAIDDRLGKLKYNQIVTGRRDCESPTDYIISADGYYCNFITTQGEFIKNIHIGSNTLYSPEIRLLNDDDEVRLYIDNIPIRNDPENVIKVVVKIELIKKTSVTSQRYCRKAVT